MIRTSTRLSRGMMGGLVNREGYLDHWVHLYTEENRLVFRGHAVNCERGEEQDDDRHCYVTSLERFFSAAIAKRLEYNL